MRRVSLDLAAQGALLLQPALRAKNLILNLVFTNEMKASHLWFLGNVQFLDAEFTISHLSMSSEVLSNLTKGDHSQQYLTHENAGFMQQLRVRELTIIETKNWEDGPCFDLKTLPNKIQKLTVDFQEISFSEPSESEGSENSAPILLVKSLEILAKKSS